MNTTLHDLLVTWGFCSLITIIGFWLSSRLPFPNLGCEKKMKLKQYILGVAVAPLTAMFIFICGITYVYIWGAYFWDKIKDIEI